MLKSRNERLIRFKPKTEDEDEVELRGTDLDKLCTIEITLRQGKCSMLEERPHGFGPTFPQMGLVHEKAIK